MGYSGLLGLGLSGLFGGRTVAAPRRSGSVILILLSGGPSQLDTFDPKPEAPAEIRGSFQSVPTRLPGVRFCEHLPLLAARADRLAVVRSLSHHDNAHLPATHHLLTGQVMPLRRDTDLDNVLSRRDWPCYAAGLDFLRPRHDGVPNGVTLPNHLVEGPLTWPGQHGGFLGARNDPWQIRADPNKPDFRVENLTLPEGFDVARLHGRRTLLEEVDAHRRELAALAEGRQLAGHQRQALELLTSGRVAKAFEMRREPETVRQRYGRHLFGQSLLLARRLVEAGVPVIQVNMGIVQTWDTHIANFRKLKNRLLPPLDQGVSALLDDLEARGLLRETLVAMLGEFGRTPKISYLPGAKEPGRDHWAPVYSGVFAGGGVRGGQVIGKSDRIAAYPTSTAYSPHDIGATVYNALGIRPDAEIHDALGRPLRINQGEVIGPLFTGAAG